MKQRLKLIGIIVVMAMRVTAQEEYPRTKHPMPYMALALQGEITRNTSTTQLRGKPLVLYFFGKGCIASFIHLGELNNLYKKYRHVMQVVAVGKDLGDNIETAYNRYQTRFNWVLPVSYDSVYYKKFRVKGVPHVIWIDRNGIVKAVTASVKEKDVEKFLRDEPFDFEDTSVEGKQTRPALRADKPFLIDGNGGDPEDFQYRSLLTQWKPGMPIQAIGTYIPGRHPLANVKELNLIGRELTELYRVAYWGRAFPWGPTDTSFYGKNSWEIKVEVSDSIKFFNPHAGEKILYAYSQSVPEDRRTPEARMKIMQADLRNYFGYEVSFEKRKMPCLRLIAKENAKDKLAVNPQKGRSQADDIIGGQFNNISISVLVGLISHTARLEVNNIPLLNETGITGNIDIDLQAVMTDLEDIKRVLRTYGLDIVPGEREMNTMIIRESTLKKGEVP